MKCYRVWYDNNAAVLVDAYTAEDAIRQADEMADRDGYPGLKAIRAECLSD